MSSTMFDRMLAVAGSLRVVAAMILGTAGGNRSSLWRHGLDMRRLSRGLEEIHQAALQAQWLRDLLDVSS